MSTVNTDRTPGWFVRAAAAIGDLSNPFYGEERQRDVWNEASTPINRLPGLPPRALPSA